jgi:hypothetical protein
MRTLAQQARAGRGGPCSIAAQSASLDSGSLLRFGAVHGCQLITRPGHRDAAGGLIGGAVRQRCHTATCHTAASIGQITTAAARVRQ